MLSVATKSLKTERNAIVAMTKSNVETSAVTPGLSVMLIKLEILQPKGAAAGPTLNAGKFITQNKLIRRARRSENSPPIMK